MTKNLDLIHAAKFLAPAMKIFVMVQACGIFMSIYGVPIETSTYILRLLIVLEFPIYNYRTSRIVEFLAISL